jgi:hypothetical protein
VKVFERAAWQKFRCEESLGLRGESGKMKTADV